MSVSVTLNSLWPLSMPNTNYSLKAPYFILHLDSGIQRAFVKNGFVNVVDLLYTAIGGRDWPVWWLDLRAIGRHDGVRGLCVFQMVD